MVDYNLWSRRRYLLIMCTLPQMYAICQVVFNGVLVYQDIVSGALPPTIYACVTVAGVMTEHGLGIVLTGDALLVIIIVIIYVWAYVRARRTGERLR